jgi:poly-gamma-glutamate synthesis protein (capsule biosynthesis protein)
MWIRLKFQDFRIFFIILPIASFMLGSGFAGVKPAPIQKLHDGEWIYLKGDGSEVHSDDSIHILAVGDVMLGRGVLKGNYPFELVDRELAEADLVIGNFEGAIVGAEGNVPEILGVGDPARLLISAPDSSAMELQKSGFDILSLANNHTADYGAYGLERTAKVLQRSGISITGAGSSKSDAFEPLVKTVKGVRIAFLGCNAVLEPADSGSNQTNSGWQVANWDPESLFDSIGRARKKSDVVIVFIHWGDEYEPKASSRQKFGAHELIEAGADIIIGSHPHVIQETEIIEIFEGTGDRIGFVAHSLGNFVFDQFDPRTQIGLGLKIILDRSGLTGVQALPVGAGPKPHWIDRQQSIPIVEHIQPRPKRIAFICNANQCHQSTMNLEGDGVSFTTGQIDLTGDGIPETVRKKGQQIEIFEDGKISWQSPKEWVVKDFALGDPNDDGRGEVVIALMKPDKDGILQSHPFLIGYRGGIYRQVWGGSAVTNPILEIELADLDADRTPELVVLEQRDRDLQAVSVWRWKGWFFSQIWNSPEDRLRGLGVHQEDGQNPIISVGRVW